MDSPPEAAKPSIAAVSCGHEPSAATSDSPPVHESPFSNYVSRLSPINLFKVSNAITAQGLLGLNSLSLVFTSPHLTQSRATSLLQRSAFPQVCENEDQREEFFDASCNVGKPSTSTRIPLVADTHMDAKTPSRDAPSSSSVCIDEYLSEPLEVECANSVNSASVKLKQVNDSLQLSAIHSSDPKEVVSEDNEVLEIGKDVEKLQMSCKQDEEEPREHPTSETKQEEVQKQQNDAQLSTDFPSAEGDSIYHTTSKEECSMEGAQKHDDASEVMRVISSVSTQNVMQHDPEASHLQRGLSRRCLQFEEALPPCLAKRPLVVSRRSGIGLHLNSFTRHKETATAEGDPGMCSQIIDKSDGCSSFASMVENAPVSNGEITVKDEAKVAAISEPFCKIETLDIMQPLEATPLNNRKPNLDFTNSFEGFTTKKKRKKSSDADSDGCKRCNCKKTKCLKLYCDCFAAGIYCADPCSCQGCFNRPEYRDTVLETRHQIESRNPLAFAPKIVQDVTEFPATIGEDKSLGATSSVRHKRGCNCKKSMCLKKYCECYQSNVGCSHECRCEGCKNLFGKKGEYGMTDDIIALRARDGISEGPGDDKLAFIATDNDLSQLELYDQHSMTPLTPFFQYSDHGKDAPKPRFFRFVPSPESDPSMLPPYARTLHYPSNVYSNDVSQETNRDLASDSSDQPMHYDIQMMNYSPGSEEIASISGFSPSQNPSLPSASSKIRSWIPLCPGSGRLLPTGPLWRMSPITHMAPSTKVKYQVLNSSGELKNVIDDDTPNILKQPAPSTSVKVTSPNKKRVTAPHGNLRETSSVGVKSGRKFILKAVPSFPPLTPCTESKSSAEEKCQ